MGLRGIGSIPDNTADADLHGRSVNSKFVVGGFRNDITIGGINTHCDVTNVIYNAITENDDAVRGNQFIALAVYTRTFRPSFRRCIPWEVVDYRPRLSRTLWEKEPTIK